MKNTIEEIKNRRDIRKKLYLILAASGLVLYTVYCILFVPVWSTIASDIRFEETVFPELIDFTCRFFEVVTLAVTCAIATLGIVKLSANKFKLGAVIYVGLILYKNAVIILLNWVETGRIPSEWLWDIGYVCVMTLMEVIPFAIAFWIVVNMTRSYRERQKILNTVGREERLLPLKKLYSKKNLLHRSALVCSVVVFVTKVIGRFGSDVLVMLQSGLPTETMTVIKMLLYYFSSIVFAVICYFVMLLTVTVVGTKIVKNLDI